jgi:hypothetical protein
MERETHLLKSAKEAKAEVLRIERYKDASHGPTAARFGTDRFVWRGINPQT